MLPRRRSVVVFFCLLAAAAAFALTGTGGKNGAAPSGNNGVGKKIARGKRDTTAPRLYSARELYEYEILVFSPVTEIYGDPDIVSLEIDGYDATRVAPYDDPPVTGAWQLMPPVDISTGEVALDYTATDLAGNVTTGTLTLVPDAYPLPILGTGPVAWPFYPEDCYERGAPDPVLAADPTRVTLFA